MLINKDPGNISLEEFKKIVDEMYDELLIYDGNYNIVYINQACCRHYGCRPDTMIGKNFFDFVNDGWWGPSILPVIYQEKHAYAIKQSTYIGSELLTIAVPLFDDDKKIKYVAMNVRDEINNVDLYNPQYISENDEKRTKIVPVHKSVEMGKALQQVAKIARMNVSCLISGEIGTGKKVLSRYLHSISRRKDKQLCSMDCDRASSEQIEQKLSELINELNTRNGQCSLSGATLLMCEISQLSLKAQSLLLQLFPDTDNKGADVRILATTSKNLNSMVNNGQFREDLYYRLNVSDVYIPPLRRRREDIRPLIYMFIQEICNQYDVRRQFTEGVIQAMINAEWRRNVSELKYFTERLIAMSDNLMIDVDQLPASTFGIMDNEESQNLKSAETFDEKLAKYEYYIIRDAYEKYKTSRNIAAHLGLSQTRAAKLIKKYISSDSANDDMDDADRL